MGFFKIADLNTITELGDKDKQFFIQAHCEVTEEKNSKGSEAFLVNLVSPFYLKKKLGNSIELCRGCLLMNQFSKQNTVAFLQSFIDKKKEKIWDELSTYVEKFFDWI